VFALLVSAAFGAFCIFWHQNFAEAETADIASEPVSVGCAGSAGRVLAGNGTQGEGDQATDDAPARGAARSTPRDPEARVEATMFQARIFGPYAPSVLDGLNQMVIDSSLTAQGVRGIQRDGVDMSRVLAAVPSHLPAHGYISSRFGWRRSPFTGQRVHHNGIDFAVPYGSPVYATADGTVKRAGWMHGLGNAVVIDHGYGIVTRYGHNSRLLVRAGMHVHGGQVIARAGSTGRSTGSHVHYEVRVNGHAIDPADFMFDVPQQLVATAPEGNDIDLLADRHPEEANLGLGMGGDPDPATDSVSSKGADAQIVLATSGSQASGKGLLASSRRPLLATSLRAQSHQLVNVAIVVVFALLAFGAVALLVPFWPLDDDEI